MLEKFNFKSILHYTIGLVIIIEGADKFFNLLVDWKIFAAPEILTIWPFSDSSFLIFLGFVEIIVGVMFLISARLGSLVVAGLMLGIIFNLLLLGYYFNMILLNIIVAIAALTVGQARHFEKQGSSG